MNRISNKGFTLIEVVVAVALIGTVMGTAMMLLTNTLKDWKYGETNLEVLYNCKETLNLLEKEIRESCGAEIIDPDNGWIKLYKSHDKNSFTTFRIKNNKMFIGFNSTLNPNTELSRHLDVFKVSYLPEDLTDANNASGIKIHLEFLLDKKKYEINTSVAFRAK